MGSYYQSSRLWGGAVPILTTNLLESGIIDATFNNTLTQVAVSAFDGFTTNSTPTNPLPSLEHYQENETSSSRRRRRTRTSKLKGPDLDNPTSPETNEVTPNDNFFEFQRIRGYRLSTPFISDCEAVRQLEEDHVVNAAGHYLRTISNDGMANHIANELQTHGTGLSVDLWAAVQRGKGAHHSFHVHEGAIVSGVYYSSCPMGCAPLVLKKPAGDGIK